MSSFSTSFYSSRKLIHSRDLLYELVTRNIKVRYKGSILGILWSLIYSVAQARIFVFLFRAGLGRGAENFPAYVFVGIMVWQWFQSSLTLTSEAITGNRDLLRRPGFPTFVLPVVIVVTSMIDFLIAFPVLIVFLFVGGTPIRPTLALLPLAVLLQFFLSLSLGYLFATFQVTFRDTKHILSVCLRLGFFLAPIFYDPIQLIPERYLWLYRLNPVVHLIEFYRSFILEGTFPATTSLLYLSGLAFILLPVGYITFTQAKYRFLEEL